MPARAPASMLMLQMVMRPSIESARMAEPAYSMTQPVAPSVPILPMMARMMSLAVTPVGSSPSTAMRKVLGLDCGSVCVASTCSTSLVPMPNASAPNAPWVRGVRVAADDGHAGLGDAEFGADDVDDALLARVDVVELDAEVGAVLAQRGDLRGGDLVDDVEAAFDGGGHVVIDGGDAAVGAAHLAAGEAQAFKSLRRSDLVEQLQVDVEQRGLALRLDHDVLLPDFFE